MELIRALGTGSVGVDTAVFIYFIEGPRRPLLPDCGYGVSSLTGRTSTLPSRAGGIFAATRIASFRSLASIR